VIGTNGNTGTGGANVWTYDNVLEALPDHFEPLPKRASMRVAIRRTTRVGGRAGDPVEDLGVVPDMVVPLTDRDLLQRNVQLLAKVADVLSAQPRRGLTLGLTPHPGSIEVAFTTKGLDRGRRLRGRAARRHRGRGGRPPHPDRRRRRRLAPGRAPRIRERRARGLPQGDQRGVTAPGSLPRVLVEPASDRVEPASDSEQ
jgi:hypothetical protein